MKLENTDVKVFIVTDMHSSNDTSTRSPRPVRRACFHAATAATAA